MATPNETSPVRSLYPITSSCVRNVPGNGSVSTELRNKVVPGALPRGPPLAPRLLMATWSPTCQYLSARLVPPGRVRAVVLLEPRSKSLLLVLGSTGPHGPQTAWNSESEEVGSRFSASGLYRLMFTR